MKYLFAGTICFPQEVSIPDDFEFDYVESVWAEWEKNVYIFWETSLQTSEKILDYCTEKLWEIPYYDISISDEDDVIVIPYDYEEWIYEVVSFEWEHITFKEIQSRFKDTPEVFSIRWCEKSKRFGNKIIRVDFVY